MNAARLKELIEALSADGGTRITLTGPNAGSRVGVVKAILDEAAVANGKINDIIVVVEDEHLLKQLTFDQVILPLGRDVKFRGYPGLIQREDVDSILDALEPMTLNQIHFEDLIKKITPADKHLMIGIKQKPSRTLLNGATGSERHLHSKKGSAKAHDPRTRRRGY